MSAITLDKVITASEELIDAKLAASPVLQRRIAEARANYEAGEGGSYEVLREIIHRKYLEKYLKRM